MNTNANNNNNNTSGIIEFKKCPRCNTSNEPTARICSHCDMIIDPVHANMHKEEQKELIRELEAKVKRLEELFNALVQRLSA